MKRLICCIPYHLKKEDMDGRRAQNKEKEGISSHEKKPILNTSLQENEVVTSNQASPYLDSKPLIHRLSVGSSHPSSISCPQLLIENAEKEPSSNNTLRSENRNNLSVRYNNSSSPRSHAGNLSRRNQNNLLTKTSSFKRIMSFRSSKRGSEVMNFHFNFLGQIYRKKSVPSSTPRNCEEEEEEEEGKKEEGEKEKEEKDGLTNDNFDVIEATLS